jgi:hypothetical protein
MLTGVKFCGGCNPQYDRMAGYREAVRHVEMCGKTLDFEYVKDGRAYDALLVISGCPTKCADISNYEYRRLFEIWSKVQIVEVADRLARAADGV